MITNKTELGYFKRGCFRIAFDAVDNTFVFEYRLTPMDYLFIDGKKVAEIFVKQSDITLVQNT